MDLKLQYDNLLRYCYAKTKDRYLAEDIVQETFLRFWESKSYKNMGKEQAYLYTIARNLCMDEFRRPQNLDIDECGLSDSLKNDNVDLFLSRLELDRALNKLPDDLKEIIVLRYANEVRVSDIGRILGLSRFAVRRRLNQGLSELRNIMEGGEGE